MAYSTFFTLTSGIILIVSDDKPAETDHNAPPEVIPDDLPAMEPIDPKPMRKFKINKKLIVAVVILVLVLVVAWYLFLKPKSSQDAVGGSAQTTQTKTQTATDDSTVRLIAGGDFVFHDSINDNAKQSDGSYDYLQFMSDFQPIFARADIRFCNQVTPIGGTQFGVSGYPKFNAPLDAITDMSKLGCNLINMASNHSFDVSQDAISANVEAWSKQDGVLAAAGQNTSEAEKNKVHYFTIKGVKFAFLAYTTYINGDAPATNNYGVTKYSRSLAASQIKEAKTNGADVIIASMRWGTEYSASVTASQKSEAQYLADQGVSLVLGHGSHVLEPVIKLTGAKGNKTYVWYSLGNFLNTQLEPEALFNGLAVVDYDTSKKQITNMAFLPLYMHYEWTAVQSSSQDLLARKNIHMYLLEDTTQDMIDAQQLKTTVSAQTKRITTTLNTYLKVPLLTNSEYLAQ